jgi:hypothetical protein
MRNKGNVVCDKVKPQTSQWTQVTRRDEIHQK